MADDPGISFDENGIEINIAGDDLSLTLGGRLHLDSNFFDNGLTVFNDDSGVRRGRLELGGRVLKDWRFRLDREFSSQGRGFKNAWLSYRGIDHVELVGGNFTTPFSLEALTSSNATAGMERSLANALAPN
ncbi:MAG TPA: porin, partial [Parvularculaceae bacterium]|nr:porin [Parvularculaceae bacterium]